MTASQYQHLLSPGRIGAMRLRNRMIVTAMGVSFAEPDGRWGDRIRAYHERQAQGGAALINTGATGVAWPVGGVQCNQLALSDDRYIPGVAATAEAVHRHGAKLSIQLHHGGPNSVEDMLAGRPVLVPSVPNLAPGGYAHVFLPEEMEQSAFGKITSIDYHPLTRDEIRVAVEQFAEAADRAKRAGVDGVEIHGGHGYLISAFLSSKSNRREDEYGGPLENRARLMVEIIRAIRSAVGAQFPLWIKLDSREIDKPGGITIEDAIQTAKLAQAAGVDAITVSAYHGTDKGNRDAGSHTPHIPGANLPYAAQIKAAVTAPVIASGRIEPEVGEQAIAEGKADFIALGRKILADPDLPRKIATGKPADILPCIYCYTCISAIFVSEPTHCAVNPETGFEYLAKPAAGMPRRRILVVGGGPAGMEAARRLSAKGHTVTLLDAGNRLGGTLRFAALAYEPNEKILNWLTKAVEASTVDVRLETVATPELAASLSPDLVIVATGAKRTMPSLPGAELPHVFSGDDLRQLMLGQTSDSLRAKTGLGARLVSKLAAATNLNANLDMIRQATRAWMPLGQNIVIIGGELVGLELAEFLIERGRSVSIVDDAPRFGKGMPILRRLLSLEALGSHATPMYAGASGLRIGSKSVEFTDASGARRNLPADNVIVAKGATGDTHLADALRAAGLRVRTAGDANGVGYIEGAMRGAAEAVADL